MILGIDFSHESGLVLDFTQTLVQVRQPTVGSCSITPLLETPVDAVDECAVPEFWKTSSVELPECVGSDFSAILESIRTCSKQSQVQQRSPVTVFLTQEIQPECHPVAFQPNTERKCRGSWKRCWTKASLKRVAALGWHQQCMYVRIRVSYTCVYRLQRAQQVDSKGCISIIIAR